MSDSEQHLDRPEIQQNPGWFRLDVVLTALSGITIIDWEDDFWKDHANPQPFQNEIGTLLSYLAVDGRLEIFQFERTANDVKDGLLEQLRATNPDLNWLLDFMPDEDNSTTEEDTIWLDAARHNYSMDQLIELSPVYAPHHERNLDPGLEFILMGGQVLGSLEDLTRLESED